MVWMVMWMCAAVTMAADPKVGDTRASVLDGLGNPKGTMVVGRNETLIYNRGTLQLTDGKVTRVKLMTDGEYAAMVADAEQRAKLAEEARARLVQEGIAEKARTLADADFARKPPSDQYAYWKQFAARYPGVDVRAQLKPPPPPPAPLPAEQKKPDAATPAK
jgi:hypothetical protein